MRTLPERPHPRDREVHCIYQPAPDPRWRNVGIIGPYGQRDRDRIAKLEARIEYLEDLAPRAAERRQRRQEEGK